MRRPSRTTPKPMFARPSGSGKLHAYPGRRSGSNHTYRRLGGGPGDVAGVLTERVPLAEVPRRRPGEQLAGGRPHAVGRDRRSDAVTVPSPATSASTRSLDWRMAGERMAVTHDRHPPRGPAASSAASSSRRGWWRRRFRRSGSGRHTSRPDGDRSQAASTVCQFGTCSGRRPSVSSSRSARVVRPSPQHLSRGNAALSITTTDRPARASRVAAVLPAGPAPTTSTSTVMVAAGRQGTATDRLWAAAAGSTASPCPGARPA